MSVFDTFPKYFKQSLLTVSETGCICVITFWTRKEDVLNDIPQKYRERVLLIGNLYTENGIQYIVKNSLLCPQIYGFILIGNDKNSVKTTLLSKDYYYTRDSNFKRFYDSFIASGRMYDYTMNFDRLIPMITRECDRSTSNWITEPIDCYSEELTQTNSLPSEHQGFHIRDTSLERLWHKALTLIKRFGIERTTANGKKYREIIGLTSVLELSSGEILKMPNNAPLSSTIEAYSAQIITDSPQPGIEYTYGQRLYDHGQINSIIEKLKTDKANRQAIGVTWNLPKDSTSLYPPCCVVADFKVQPRSLNGTIVDVLYLTIYFRSHDIYSAYCANIYGFHKLQEMIAAFTDCVPGYIMVVSNSAHVYDYDYPQALIYDELGCRMDPRGYFIIEVIDDQELFESWIKDGSYRLFGQQNREFINASIIGKEWRIPYRGKHHWIITDYNGYITEICNNKFRGDPWKPMSNAERAMDGEYLSWFDGMIYWDIQNGMKSFVRKPKQIKLTYMSPSDQPIASTTGLDVQKLCDFAMPYISEISHAMYLGRELQRARNCINNGKPYEQS